MASAPAFAKGAAVIVAPPCYPLARYRGTIERRTPNGWRVRCDAFGVMITETYPESALSLASPEEI